MSDENNVKYIPELWLENDKDEDLKIAFMTALFNQWNGEGKGFDADKVDGWHLAKILNYTNERTKDKLSQFFIGQTVFSETNKPAEGKYTLGFDAIKLYNPDTAIINPLYTSDQKKLPWADWVDTEEKLDEPFDEYEYLNPETSSPNLYDIFKELFIILTNGLNKKLDTAAFDRYQDKQAPLNEIVTNYKNKGYYQVVEEEGQTRYLFNADQLNGVRIFIKTQAQYNALSNEIKENPRNLIFIIDEADLHEDGDINKPLKYNIENPDTCPISEYYDFKVADDPVTGVPTLYYQHPIGNTWISMGVTADQFLDMSTLTDKVTQVLNTSSNYTINQEVFKNSFKNITVANTDDYPFLSYLKNNYVHGGIYEKADGTLARAPNTTYNNDGYTYIDLKTPLDVLKNDFQSQLTEVDTSINGLNTLIGNVQTVADRADQNASNSLSSLTSLKNGSTSTIKSLDDRIAALERDFVPKSDLEWEKMYLAFFDSIYGGGDEQSYIHYNKKLQIAKIYLDFKIDYRKSDSGKWVELSRPNTAYGNNVIIGNFFRFYDNNPNYTGINNAMYNLENQGYNVSRSPYLPKDLKPFSGAVGMNFKSSSETGPMFVKFDNYNNPGKIYTYCKAGSNLDNVKVTTSITYKISGE